MFAINTGPYKDVDMSTNQELREQQRQSWNKFSPGWSKWDTLLMASLAALGEEMLKSVPQRVNRLLDVATGTGEPALSYAKENPESRVTGVDLSEGMVRIARAHAASKNITNYEVDVADASQLNVDDDTYDAITCRLGIMFFPDPGQAIQELKRVLKTGGTLCLTVWGPPQKNEWLTIAGGTVKKMLELPTPPKESPGVFRFSEQGELLQLMKESGGLSVEEREVRGEMKYESAEQYLEMMMDIAAPIVSALDKVDQRKRTEVCDSILAQARSRLVDGGLTFEWKAWLLVAKKI
jgi:ubiquinone/menaquinone biosynthesis C-methylase UbiE